MARIIEKPTEISIDHYVMKIAINDVHCLPGQFVSIRPAASGLLLRKPFSVHNQNGDILEIIIKIVGPGTRHLCTSVEIGPIDILAPLGNSFTVPQGQNTLLIGGGVGNAPLFYLMTALKAAGNRITYCYGAKTAAAVFLPEKYRSLADHFVLLTDDGSAGLRGLVTDHLGSIMAAGHFDRIYMCGPALMMRSACSLVERASSIIEVSVENYFGCGFGVCSGCSIDTRDGRKRVCVDGPIFDACSIDWNKLIH